MSKLNITYETHLLAQGVPWSIASEKVDQFNRQTGYPPPYDWHFPSKKLLDFIASLKEEFPKDYYWTCECRRPEEGLLRVNLGQIGGTFDPTVLTHCDILQPRQVANLLLVRIRKT